MTDTLGKTRAPGSPAEADRPRPEPAPRPRLPDIPGPLDTLRYAWRRLRRMSTALLLLFALAVASLIATIVPQEPVIAQTVADWRSGAAGPGEQVAAVLDALGLFDVFGSSWFAALTVLLFISLTGCLIPRYRAFWRNARRPPSAGRNLDRLSNHRVVPTALAPDEALAVVQRALRRRRLRLRLLDSSETVSGHDQLASERGHWREGGSLIFHSAFYLLLVGIVIGQGFGFTGQVNVAEGGVFTDTRIFYGLAEPGRWFDASDHRGFTVRLDDFDVAWDERFVPEHFISTVSIIEDGAVVRSGETVAVNHPLVYQGMKIFQMRFGMAPRVIVRAGDEVVYDDQVLMSQQGGAWVGVAKVSAAEPQIALDLLLLPDAGVAGEGESAQIVNRGPELDNPRLFADLYVGDLGLERPVPASEFDRDPAQRVGDPVALAEGDVAELAGGRLSVEFAEVTMWSGFQVSHSPGRRVLLASGILILAGLIPSLYSYRRRIWAEARPGRNGTDVLLAGVALQRKQLFAQRFSELADSLEGDLGHKRSQQEPKP